MFEFLKKTSFACPADGELIPLIEVRDEVFAKGMMGTGFALLPTTSKLYAPMDGIVNVVFPTGHAYGICGKDGMEVLIHIGIDTVELNGTGFTAHKTQGDEVRQGELLAEVDLPYLKKMGKADTCIILFPNKEKICLQKEHEQVLHGDTSIVKIRK